MSDHVIPRLRVQLLGPFQVSVGACAVDARTWRSQRASAIVKVLALAPHYRVHREQLMEALWPDLDPDDQANNLNVAASRARQALAVAGAPRGAFIVRAGETLTLGPPENIEVDVTYLEDVIARAWQTDDLAAFRDASAAIAGELLPDDLYEDWCADRRTRLRTSQRAVLVRYGQLATASGAIDEAIHAYQRLLDIDPVHEEGHLALMRLYARAGQRSRALEQFARLAAALDQEVGVSPEPTAVDLAEAIRSGCYPKLDDRVAIPVRPAVPLSAFEIPSPIDALIGRQQEIAEVGQALTGSRLVTLTGPGGIGKTRLALAVVPFVRPMFPDGIAFIDLSALRESDDVLPTIARSLHVREVSGRPSVSAVARQLAERRLLIVLDNFEQVVAAGPIVRELLERAPLLRVLVTSRVPLRVRGEAEYPVPSLALPDPGADASDAPAVTLFLHRARNSKPSLTVTADNQRTINEICRRLDGLPLAIELAAARIKVLTPAAMLSRLDRPLELLVDGPRDLPPRQQTIRETIAWSHNLLSPPEQRLLWRLSVFAGGWTLAMAEAVAGGRSDQTAELGITILDGLASLVDKNLSYQRDVGGGDTRFGMLETIREFAAEQLISAGEEIDLRDRHAAVLVALVERLAPLLESSDLVEALAELDREEANIREALQWVRSRGESELALRLVVALRPYWFIRGRLVKACEISLAASKLPIGPDLIGLRLDALNCAGYFAREYGDYELAQQIGRVALTESRDRGDRKREGDALANLAFAALQQGSLDEAKTLLGDCLDANRGLGNDQGVADALSMLALIAVAEGDYATARQLDEECLTIWDALGDLQAVAWIHVRLAEVMLRQGEQNAAYQSLMTALTMARDLRFWWGFSWAFDSLAHLAVARESFPLAATLASKAAAVRRDVGLRLTPTEQAAVDRLHAVLHNALGVDALSVAAPFRGEQTIDTLIGLIREQLGEVVGR